MFQNISEKLSKVVKFLCQEFPSGVQMFDTRNIVGDPMENIYSEDGIDIDYCYAYNYIEVFGLTEEEFIFLNQLDFKKCH